MTARVRSSVCKIMAFNENVRYVHQNNYFDEHWSISQKEFCESKHDKTYSIAWATCEELGLRSRASWSEPSLGALWLAQDPSPLHADKEVAGQNVCTFLSSLGAHAILQVLSYIWSASWQNQQNGMCGQRRLRSAWACAQSNQCLCCALSG